MIMEKFISFAKEYGLIIDEGGVIADGRIHRVPIEGAKRESSRDGAYCLYDNVGGIAGWIQNHRSGEYVVYSQKAEGYSLFTTNISNKVRLHAQIQKEQTTAAKTAQNIINNVCKHAYNHPYMQKKRIFAFGALVDNYDVLIIPLKNINGEIRSFQRIYNDGQKSFLKGGQLNSCFFLIGKVEKIIIICEGYATASSIHECTKLPVAAALTASNLVNVAIEFRKKYGQEVKIIIAGDDDHQLESNTGQKYATAAAEAVNGEVIFPLLDKSEKAKGLTDFNDLHQSRGKKIVAELFVTSIPLH